MGGEAETRRVIAVTGATRGELPAPCVDCVFWQHRGAVSDPARKDRWVRRAEASGGVWGRLLRSGGEVEGMIQYGPASLFPRARRLPAGPPDADAALVTCVFLGEDDPAGILERLALECLADLKARGTPAVEVFARTRPDGAPLAPGHHTLLDTALLRRLGFSVRRERGPVALMRLRLGGLETATERRRILPRLRWTPHPIPPAPVTP